MASPGSAAPGYITVDAVAACIRVCFVLGVSAGLVAYGARTEWRVYWLATLLLGCSGAVIWNSRHRRPSTWLSLSALTLEVLFMSELIRALRSLGLGDAEWVFVLYYVPVFVAALLHGPPGAIYTAALAILAFLVRLGGYARLMADLLQEMWLSHFVPLVLVAVLLGYLAVIADRERKRRVEQDLELVRYHQTFALAREMQEALRPELVTALPHTDLAVRLVAADRAFGGGDFCSIVELPDGRYAIAVADIAGKTLTGLATVPLAYAAFWVAAHHHHRPEDCVEEIDRLLGSATQPDVFAAFFVAIYDPPTGRLTYCNAGQPDALILRAGGSEPLSLGGPAAGAVPGAAREPYESGETHLDPGDWLVIGSDGAIGSEGSRGRVEALAKRMPGADRLCDAILASADAHDDRSLVVMRRAPEATIGEE